MNRQIWGRLQALVAKAETTATTLLQPTNKEEEETRVHPPGEELDRKSDGGSALGGNWSRRTEDIECQCWEEVTGWYVVSCCCLCLWKESCCIDRQRGLTVVHGPRDSNTL